MIRTKNSNRLLESWTKKLIHYMKNVCNNIGISFLRKFSCFYCQKLTEEKAKINTLSSDVWNNTINWTPVVSYRESYCTMSTIFLTR